MAESVYWLWFSHAFNYSYGRGALLLEAFPDARAVFESDDTALRVSGVFTEQQIRTLRATSLEEGWKILRRCDTIGCDILTPDDPAFPERLRQIDSVPMALYVKGSLEGIDRQAAIAMVGTRKLSDYGVAVARMLSQDLARCGAVIVSGLALGIDTECHKGALRAGGLTVAVVGCGLDYDYPRSNRELKQMIENNGAVVSEYPPGVPALSHHFPQRNRLISGLSLGVVVVEADVRSGSLITAGHAMTQNRDVFAVPGSILDPNSRGTIRLIQQGAKPVTCAKDILEEYTALFGDKLILEEPEPRPYPGNTAKGPKKRQKEASRQKGAPPEYLTDRQLTVYTALAVEPLGVEELASATGLAVYELLTALTEMEIFGIVKAHPGRRFSA